MPARFVLKEEIGRGPLGRRPQGRGHRRTRRRSRCASCPRPPPPHLEAVVADTRAAMEVVHPGLVRVLGVCDVGRPAGDRDRVRPGREPRRAAQGRAEVHAAAGAGDREGGGAGAGRAARARARARLDPALERHVRRGRDQARRPRPRAPAPRAGADQPLLAPPKGASTPRATSLPWARCSTTWWRARPRGPGRRCRCPRRSTPSCRGASIRGRRRGPEPKRSRPSSARSASTREPTSRTARGRTSPPGRRSSARG